MKTRNPILLHFLMAGLALIVVHRSTAQTLIPLHSFSASDHSNPYGGLILSGNTLYGTTEGDEFDGSGFGTVFKVNIDGTGFSNLHAFSGSDGASPYGGVILAGDTLYGAANKGGSAGYGTVFKVKTDGTGFESLYDFTGGADGANPTIALAMSGNTLYGATYFGGDSGSGTLFALSTNGTGFRVVHSFTTLNGSLGVEGSNSDGAKPRSGLILSGNTLYGATATGGSSGYGTAFKVNTDGSGFVNLHSFYADPSLPADTSLTNSEGVYPRTGLVLSGDTLYGMAQDGGTGAAGCVWAITTDGASFRNLHSFQYSTDGAYPRAGLVLAGNTLYGAAAWGGNSGSGTLFTINTNGTGFKTLATFTQIPYYNPPAPSPNHAGANPYGCLVLAGNTLYGTTQGGGASGFGTVFKFSLPAPQLKVAHTGTNVALTWPTSTAGFDYTGYTLQSTTNLVSPVWNTASPGPIVIDGQNVVTSSISGTQQFYRLNQ